MAGIVACAWTLAREHGIAGVSLHALAREVGIRQPSLYEYFDSKNALYDAMFADGNQRLVERLDAVTFSREPRDALKQFLAAFTTFAGEDPARYQLLFQRPIPGFTPSPESYALAEEVLGLPVRRGMPRGIGGLVDVVKSPMYATGVGLVVYGARHTDRRLFRIREENVYRKVRGRMREWLEEIF